MKRRPTGRRSDANNLWLLCARTGRCRLWRLAILGPAFIAEVATLLGFTPALGRFAVFVHLFLHVAGGFFSFPLDAHGGLLSHWWFVLEINAGGAETFPSAVIHTRESTTYMFAVAENSTLHPQKCYEVIVAC